MGIEALLSTQIIDTTAVGRAVMTAADAAAARTAIGAGTSSFSGAYSALSGIPSTFAPSAHKTSHATGGSDALTAADIGAAATSHAHAASDITSGTIATARLATGTASASTYLRGDQTWQAIAAGGISSLNALTDATQTFAAGTSGTNFAISSASGVHTFNLPDASATARGVVTTGSQTFAGAKTFSGNVTGQGNMALPGNGGLATWQNDGFTFQGGARLVGTNNGIQCWITCQNGVLVGFTNANGVVIGQQLGFESNYGATGNPDVVLLRDAADVLAQRRGTNAQSYRIYNTFTSTTSFERLNIAWAANICTIGTEAGSGGGTLRGLRIGGASSSLVGLWGATPIAQPTTAVAAATRVGGGGTALTDTDTFDGYTLAQIVKALRNIGALT